MFVVCVMNTLFGFLKFIVMTDHRLLIPILYSYMVDALENLRLQILKKKISEPLHSCMACGQVSLTLDQGMNSLQTSSCMEQGFLFLLSYVITPSYACMMGIEVLKWCNKGQGRQSSYQVSTQILPALFNPVNLASPVCIKNPWSLTTTLQGFLSLCQLTSLQGQGSP